MNKPRLGADPFHRGQMEQVIDTLTATQPEKKEEPKKKTVIKAGGRKPGRPVTNTRDTSKSSQEGLPEGWTRASFILKEETLEKLKDYAYTDRKQIKEVITEALDSFLKGKKIIKRERS